MLAASFWAAAQPVRFYQVLLNQTRQQWRICFICTAVLGALASWWLNNRASVKKQFPMQF
jgi:uncharacterized membrane protein YwzB